MFSGDGPPPFGIMAALASLEVALVENTCAHAVASLSSGVSSVVPFGFTAIPEGSSSRPSRQPIARFSSASIGDADKIDKPRESLLPGLCSWNPSAFLRAAAPRAPVIALPPSRKRPVR